MWMIQNSKTLSPKYCYWLECSMKVEYCKMYKLKKYAVREFQDMQLDPKIWSVVKVHWHYAR